MYRSVLENKRRENEPHNLTSQMAIILYRTRFITTEVANSEMVRWRICAKWESCLSVSVSLPNFPSSCTVVPQTLCLKHTTVIPVDTPSGYRNPGHHIIQIVRCRGIPKSTPKAIAQPRQSVGRQLHLLRAVQCSISESVMERHPVRHCVYATPESLAHLQSYRFLGANRMHQRQP